MESDSNALEKKTRWINNGLPRKGWSIDSVEYEEDSLNCEWCLTEIHWVFYLTNPEEPTAHIAGCVCTEKLTEDYKRPRELEKQAKAARQKQSRLEANLARQKEELFLRISSPYTWGFSKKGNRWMRWNGKVITIFSAAQGYKWVYDGHFSPVFPSISDAAKDVAATIRDGDLDA